MQNLIFYLHISQTIDEIYAETPRIHCKQSGFESQVMSRITRESLRKGNATEEEEEKEEGPFRSL